MKRLYVMTITILMTFGLATAIMAQDAAGDHVTVPLTDPSRPAIIKANLMTGSITVHGYSGKEVIVDAKARNEERSRSHAPEEAKGLKSLKAIPNTSTGLKVEEENNEVKVTSGAWSRPVDLIIQVPSHSSLKLNTVNDGDIKVDQVDGEIEVNDINGAVSLNHVAGVVVAHALNGNVVVTLDRVDTNKPMSFSSLNGNIDVTLPLATKANISMKSDQGEIYSDFDMHLTSKSKANVEEKPGKGGQFRYHEESKMVGTLNGGGPEFQFKTFNGNIYIRKGTK